jgi:uncharacterized BrkB/YihY/UPF0761 family membrane protein
MSDEKKGQRFLNFLMELGPYIVVSIAFLISVGAIISLLLVDVYTGKVVSEHILNQSGDKYIDWAASLATTGLLIGLVALYMEARKRKWRDYVLIGLLTGAGLIQVADIYLDMMAVDISRFGEIVFVSGRLSQPEAIAHWVFRGMIGLISLIGEPIAIGAVVMFPMLKSLMRSILPSIKELESPKPFVKPGFSPQTDRKTDIPSSIPRQSSGMPSYHPIGGGMRPKK